MNRKATEAWIALALILSSILSEPSTAGLQSQSLNVDTGIIDANYAEYLSKHDVVFNRPVTDPQSGSTVGNGRVGAMVWNENGLTLQVSGVDASEQTAFSAGVVRLYTTPGMDTKYSRFQQRLSLYNGVLTARYDANRTVTVMGSPNSELLGIHVEDARVGVSKVTVDVSIWDVSKLIGGDVPSIDTWRTVATFSDSDDVGLSRGQKDPNYFGYTLAATVQGAPFVTQSIDAKTVRLEIDPASSYTIWVACASRMNAPNHDSVTAARSILREIETQGYALTLSRYETWWHTFWQKSFVQYSSRTGDYLENLYYLYTYIIAAGSYGNYPFHFINGDFSANGDSNSSKWGVAYWHLNQADIYASFLASNHREIAHIFNHLYSRHFDVLAAQTQRRYLSEGIWVPETMGWDGNGRHTEDSDWTKHILSTGAEVAESMYAEYEYSNDLSYLRATAYPFVRMVAQFYTNKLAHDADSKRFYMASSNAGETYWNVRNAISDLAAVRSLFPIAIRASEELDVDGDIRQRWEGVLGNLAPYPIAPDGSSYAPHDPPAVENHNWQNLTSELVWPYSVTGIDAADYQMALRGWMARPYPYSNIWSDDAVQAARLGLGDEVLKGLEHNINTYQNYPNGLTSDATGRFEFLGTHLSAINESLLQSYNGKIRVFPALPNDPTFVGRFTLLANGGFLVSSECESGQIEYVAIKSLYGRIAMLMNPWINERVRVVRMADGVTVLRTSQRQFALQTKPESLYVVERADRPLTGYVHKQLTGTPNTDIKRLTGTSAVLGSAPQ